MAQITTRRAYYPGAAERRDAFVAAHPEAEELGTGPPDALPWTFIRGVAPGRTDDICFNVESFFGECAETALTAPTVEAFIDAATSFCNDVVWGTLSATLLVSPSSLRDPQVADAVERAIADLRYGAIGVNVWHALAFVIGHHQLGGLPGPSADRHSVGLGCGRQCPDVRPTPEVGRARAVPIPAEATLVRHGTRPV